MVLPVAFLFLVFSFLFLFSKENQSCKKLKFVLPCFVFILTFICTFRPEDMADRENYLSFWYHGWGGERFEWGFVILTEYLRTLSYSEYWFLFVFALFSIGLKIWGICRISPLIWASLLIYIGNIFILHDMIQMRCAMASGLLLHAIYYIGNRDKKRFIVTVIVAFLFHYSSLIFLPLWFLNIKQSHKHYFIGLIVISYIVGPFFPINTFIQMIPIDGVQTLWDLYESTVDEKINVFNAMQLGRIAICLFLFGFIDRISYYNKYAVLLVKIYAISLASLALFSKVPVIAFRVSELYQVVEIVLIPMIVYAFRGAIFFKRFSVIVIGLAFLLMNVFYMKYLK